VPKFILKLERIFQIENEKVSRCGNSVAEQYRLQVDDIFYHQLEKANHFRQRSVYISGVNFIKAFTRTNALALNFYITNNYAQLYQYTQLEVPTNCYAISSFLFVSKISVNPLAQNLFLTPGVNFISILRAAFTNADPKSAKNRVKPSAFFCTFWDLRALKLQVKRW